MKGKRTYYIQYMELSILSIKKRLSVVDSRTSVCTIDLIHTEVFPLRAQSQSSEEWRSTAISAHAEGRVEGREVIQLHASGSRARSTAAGPSYSYGSPVMTIVFASVVVCLRCTIDIHTFRLDQTIVPVIG